MDEFPVLGHQMTHSIDSYITDSANSASALYTGHKSTVNAMGYVVIFIVQLGEKTNSVVVSMLTPLRTRLMIPRLKPLLNSFNVFE